MTGSWNILHGQSRTADRGRPSSLEVVTKCCSQTLVRHKHHKMDLRFGTWNIQEPLQDRLTADSSEGVEEG
jgi:hypothetical protein